MKREINRIRFYRNMIIAFFFILSVFLVVGFFPREGRFHYDFRKGKPWFYEDLIAPFDFGISKTGQELAKEKDSILKDFCPYFYYDYEIHKKQTTLFNETFDKIWTDYGGQYTLQNAKSSRMSRALSPDSLGQIKNMVFKIVSELLDESYYKGIILVTDAIAKIKQGNIYFILLKDNVAQEYDISEVHTPEIAVKYIEKELYKKSKTLFFDRIVDQAFIEALDIKKFIVPNIYFDQETTLKYKNNLTANISLTKGMFQKGEMVISKGELVNSEKYNILTSLKNEYEKSLGYSTNYYLIFIGQILLVSISFLIVFLFLYHFRDEILKKPSEVIFLLLQIVLFFIISRFVIKYNAIYLYVIPFAMQPVIIRTFYDSKLALFIHLISTLIIAFIVPDTFQFIFLNIISGIVAIFSLASIKKRGQLFLSALVVFLTYCFIFFGLSLLQEGDIYRINYKFFTYFAGNCLLFLSSYLLIYLFEKLFNFVSDVTLMEISDTNHPLLRKLSEKAPGTFQHSLQVANLAEGAINRIGGNPLLARTGALYHDIGKMETPQYFIENQLYEKNPHDKLDFDTSAGIIISHVEKGINIAKKNKLPVQIIHFISSHHGTTKARFFLKSYMQKYTEGVIDISKFIYPGPVPYTKEQAVVMMADCVEAASRSVKTITEKSFSDLVDQIIEYQVNERQFENVNITFRDITKIKEVFKDKLLNIYHARIEYPK